MSIDIDIYIYLYLTVVCVSVCVSVRVCVCARVRACVCTALDGNHGTLQGSHADMLLEDCLNADKSADEGVLFKNRQSTMLSRCASLALAPLPSIF